LRFFLNHCVPASVARVLRDAGHVVILQKDAIATDESDPIVALASAENDAILISTDKDYRKIATRFGVSNTRLRKLSRIQLRCSEPDAASCVAAGMKFIEHEWELAQSFNDKRIFIEILGFGFKTVR
jgi:predicted nuclease of predicted toxin-antitoxin system